MVVCQDVRANTIIYQALRSDGSGRSRISTETLPSIVKAPLAGDELSAVRNDIELYAFFTTSHGICAKLNRVYGAITRVAEFTQTL